jgi:hypothetical protein
MLSLNVKTDQLLRALLLPVIRWALRCGVGYGYFKTTAKHVFYQAAVEELEKNNIRTSKAALVLLSGLYKGDVEKYKELPKDSGHDCLIDVNLTSQVAARWLITKLPIILPLKGVNSFEELVAQSHTGAIKVSPRLILQDMQRRGLAKRMNQTVELLAIDGVPAKDADRGQEHFAAVMHDHMHACLSNLDANKTNATKFLEQCLSANNLSSEAVDALHAMARVWWMEAVRTIGAEAINLSDQSQSETMNQVNRLRFGVYFYSEKTGVAV